MGSHKLYNNWLVGTDGQVIEDGFYLKGVGDFRFALISFLGTHPRNMWVIIGWIDEVIESINKQKLARMIYCSEYTESMGFHYARDLFNHFESIRFIHRDKGIIFDNLLTNKAEFLEPTLNSP
jgi:hypothetical protein